MPEKSPFKIYLYADKIPKPAELFSFGQYATSFIFEGILLNNDKIRKKDLKLILDKATKLLKPTWDYGNFLAKINRIPIGILLLGIMFIILAYDEVLMLLIGILLMFFSTIGLIVCLKKLSQYEKYILDGEAKYELAKLCKSINENMYKKGIKVRPGSMCAWIEI